MKTIILAMGLFAFTEVLASEAEDPNQNCGKITIADMNWSSATLLAHIDYFILRHGYNCEAELVPGDTMPTATSMIEKGEPDIAPELWSNSFKAALDKGVAEKRLRIAGNSLSDGGEEGFWVPQYMVDKDPSMATIEGVINNAKQFTHPEDKDRSAFMGCPSGWNCQITASNLFAALKLEGAGFELIDPGSGAGLAATIAKAYTRKQAWFGYYWKPTALLGRYNMVKVDFGSGVDKTHYLSCISTADCKNPKVTMYPPSPVLTVTTQAFATQTPQAFTYLSKRSFTNAEMSEFLAWMEDNQADGDTAMEHVLKEYTELWTPWVPATIANKIKQALVEL